MTLAYKCDNCSSYYDNDYALDHDHDEDIELGGFVFRFSWGKRPSEEEVQRLAERDSLSIFSSGPRSVEFVAAHLCDPCRGILAKQAANQILGVPVSS